MFPYKSSNLPGYAVSMGRVEIGSRNDKPDMRKDTCDNSSA